MQPPRPVRSGEVDLAAASEILNCALPLACGVAPALHKLGGLTQMLKESSITFQEAGLILLPYPVRHGDMIVNSRPFPVALLSET